jgi:segregation and condensation protein A
MSTDYRVELPVFSGPLDLLLHLVKEKEVDIHEVRISRILEDYLGYLHALTDLDLNNVGEFLVLASTLMEIKSRELLPRETMDVEKELDPREDLIRQLLEFKKYRDMARKLARFAGRRDLMFARGASGVDLPPDEDADGGTALDLGDADVWTLVKAYAKLLQETDYQREYHVKAADVPVRTYIQRVIDRLKGGGGVRFEALFDRLEGKTGLVGTFLAILELVKRGYVAVTQDEAFGTIDIVFQGPLELTADDVFGAV